MNDPGRSDTLFVADNFRASDFAMLSPTYQGNVNSKEELIMKRIMIAIVLTGALGLYCGIANAASFVAGTGTQAGTVTDLTTNLMWQQCSDGLSGATCATGTAAIVTWDSAIAYCEGLSLGGFTDWRLPNIKELKSIADMTTSNPAINTTYFPATVSSGYWSSTSYASYTTSAWGVGFGYGNTGSFVNNKATTYSVRCVRGQ